MNEISRKSARHSNNVIIIGGGPAGMSCALWLKNYGLSPVIVEKEGHLGGMQAVSPVSNIWLLGWQAVLGRDVAASFGRHMTYERVQTLLRSEILSINGSRQDGWRVAIAHQDAAAAALHRIDLDARAVVLATGTHIVGEDWIRATKGATDCRALIECGPAGCVDPNRWFGARPVIVGGGDNAANCAMILAARGSRPIILARSPHLRAAANYQAQLQELAASGQVDLRLGVSIRAVKLESASILRITTDSGDDILGERIFLTLGYGPNSHNILDKFTGRLPSLSASGYIQVDGDCETDIPGLYAIGDVANERHPCSATAIAMGTVAGRAIGNYNNRDEP